MTVPRQRRRKGLDALAEATAVAPIAVHLVAFDGVPRAFLTPEEFGAVCGVRVNRIRQMCADGEMRIQDDFQTQGYRIPVSELARFEQTAALHSP